MTKTRRMRLWSHFCRPATSPDPWGVSALGSVKRRTRCPHFEKKICINMFEPILTKPNALHVVPFSFDKEKLTLKEQMNG